MTKSQIAALPQMQMTKLAALNSLSIGMINSMTIEGICLSLDAVEEQDAEDDDG